MRQEYIREREEYVLLGAVMPQGMKNTFTVIKNIRQWPPNTGTGSYSEFVVDDSILKYGENILARIQSSGYCGNIDIEFFKTEKWEYIVNEINWRCSGRNFVSQYTGVNSALLWYLGVTGQGVAGYPMINTKKGYTMNETADIRNVLDRKISVLRWLRDLLRTRSFALWDLHDVKPVIQRYLCFFKA